MRVPERVDARGQVQLRAQFGGDRIDVVPAAPRCRATSVSANPRDGLSHERALNLGGQRSDALVDGHDAAVMQRDGVICRHSSRHSFDRRRSIFAVVAPRRIRENFVLRARHLHAVAGQFDLAEQRDLLMPVKHIAQESLIEEDRGQRAAVVAHAHFEDGEAGTARAFQLGADHFTDTEALPPGFSAAMGCGLLRSS